MRTQWNLHQDTKGCNILFLIFDIMLLAIQHMHTLKQWKIVWTAGTLKMQVFTHGHLTQASKSKYHHPYEAIGFPSWYWQA